MAINWICIAIRVDAEAQEGWWYEGAGIYRHTWLIERNAVHLITDGVFANPVRNDDGKWQIPVEATIRNDGSAPVTTTVTAELLDPEGRDRNQSLHQSRHHAPR